MKNLKTIAIALIPVSMIVFMFVWGFGNITYLKYLFTEANYSQNYENFIQLFKYLMGQIFVLFDLIVPVVYLATQDQKLKNKLYKLIRYIVVMGTLFMIPSILVQLQYFSNHDMGRIILMILRYLIFFFIAIVLWINKPEDEIPFVNLADFEMVSYTSRGHRFVHHLVDLIYCSTITFNWLQMISPRNADYSGILITSLVNSINLVLYYFVSEALFKQTLGKLFTNSCVVGVDQKLSVSKVLGRSFARLIPFDPFSFLGGGKWHDSASATTVVYAQSWKNLEFEGDEVAKPESIHQL